ncbi:hypothetical protein Poly30_07560 [Planctomycetes bacterium Poly30]|uniref:Uncharacterized protein n=1 Tax=Saltatorellus ferox TaxID=2528018 RepID=A0A518EME7_9BACT|nr:hypothetical protein Poly30_07560 [Planctomycetes bacterium Poly30]
MALGLASTTGWAASAAAGVDAELDASASVQVDFRVISAPVVSGGSTLVRIDRGASAGLAPGDRVTFRPLGGSPVQGVVQTVEERESVVDVAQATDQLMPGVPGEVAVPASRLPGGEDPQPTDQGDYPPIEWTSDEVEWTEGTPLLAEARVLEREERPPVWRGRVYMTSDLIHDGVGAGRDDLFSRLGMDARGTNLFGFGGEFRIDGEVNMRDTQVADGQGEQDTLARLDRFSYALGGVRGEPRRIEVGRFLPREFPELGLLDGAEVSWRTGAGHSVGASIGYLPSNDRERSTGDTLQISSWGTLMVDEDQRFQLGAALQKTWHMGEADRQLFLARLRWSPNGPWSAFATAWVDFYDSNDPLKQDSVELTQAIASLSRRIGKYSGVSLSSSMNRYPSLLRNGIQDLGSSIITDGSNRRVSLSGWTRLSDVDRINVRADQWADQSSSGAGGEFGWGHQLDGPRIQRINTSVFYREGRFGAVKGLRTGIGGPLSGGSWRADLDAGLFGQARFDGSQADLFQGALSLGWDGIIGADWLLSLTTAYRFGDEQDAVSLGFLLQRSF